MRVVEEVLERVKEFVPNLDEIKVAQAVLGLGYTGVKLSDGHAGLCYTFQTEIAETSQHCQVSDQAGTLVGRPAFELAKWAKSWDISESVVGLATLNALSQIAIERNQQNYDIQTGDVLEYVTFTKKDTVALIGYIAPFVEPIQAKVSKLYVLERTATRRDEGILPDTACDNIVPHADVVLITGTTLANGTIDHLLELSKKARDVAIIGATAGILPDVLFNRGVTVIGGVKITDVDKMMQVVSEGGGTPALKSAFQFVTIKPKAKKWMFRRQRGK